MNYTFEILPNEAWITLDTERIKIGPCTSLNEAWVTLARDIGEDIANRATLRRVD